MQLKIYALGIEKSSVPNLFRTVKLVECILYSTDN